MKSILDKIVEGLAILKIVASPLLIAFFLGIICLVKFPNVYGLMACILITLAGLVIGILFIKYVKKTTSAEEFNARI